MDAGAYQYRCPALESEFFDTTWNTQRSSRFLEDADYLRISDITLGLQFPTSEYPIHGNSKSIYPIRNPFTFTKYSGLDPELQYVDPDRTNNKVVAGTDNAGIPNMRSLFLV
ncbi:hypothetical protein [Bacteroides eggerthii]|uniref:hypothetical protein n=1 Tax=Bacteroides eggerthii TaxID=28111 RepID=UPI000E200143|nr:hypothetical protein [Bacteroides eggerthii]